MTNELIDKIRQSLQVIICESDNMKARVSQLEHADDPDIRESAAAIEKAVFRIEAEITGARHG